jgi:hypothetical protein
MLAGILKRFFVFYAFGEMGVSSALIQGGRSSVFFTGGFNTACLIIGTSMR